jgi:hypothetical protein
MMRDASGDECGNLVLGQEYNRPAEAGVLKKPRGSDFINPFSPISPLIPSGQVSFGLPRFLLPGGHHFITSFGNLPSSIL